MPVFWQIYAVILVVFVLPVFFISDPSWKHLFTNIVASINSVAVITILLRYKKPLIPWFFLGSAVVLIDISLVFESLIFYDFNIDPDIPFWIEQMGIASIVLFCLCIMVKFEQQYKIRGFAIDFCLLTISILCLMMLISPNLFDIAINELSLNHKILLLDLVLGAAIFVLMIINYELLNSIRLKDIILALMSLAIITHFYLDVLISFQVFGNFSILDSISLGLYLLTGVLVIFHMFTEDYHFNFSSYKSKKLAMIFLWTASITALLSIPLGVMYRWANNLPSIDPFYIACASIFLTAIVIWRIAVILTNFEQQRDKLKTIAFTDSLTGLPNYLGLRNTITKQENLLVFCINVEDFKSINELYDRKFGDQVLKNLANRLLKVPGILHAARPSGDNFLAMFETSETNIQSTFMTLEKTMGIWNTIQNRRIAVPLTYGASHGSSEFDLETLIRQSELALKTSRKNHLGFTLYKQSENENTPAANKQFPRHELREILQQSIDKNELPVHFQPIYDLTNGELKALELLIRVESEEHGLLLPGQFLDQAKSYGLLTGLTQVCINMIAKHFERLPEVTININVPPYMLNNPQTLEEFINAFYSAELPPERFCVEVTEDGDIPTEHLIPAINLLKTHGFTISMDDFGTGYSSLGRLSVLPVNSVKIDRSLLLTASGGDKAILESAINLVKRLGVSAVVEGVETLEQLALVRQLGADSVQGYLFSKPVHFRHSTIFSLNASEIITEF